MASHRDAQFTGKTWVEPNPLPSDIPKVDELGATSAPLKSASFAIGEYCKEVNGKLDSGNDVGARELAAKHAVLSLFRIIRTTHIDAVNHIL